MEKQQFLQMIKNPKELNSKDIASFENVLKVFPYFQTAHILNAKASMNSENMLAPSYLKKAAVYAGNRAQLKRFINNTLLTTTTFPEFFEESELEEVAFIEETLPKDESLIENTIEIEPVLEILDKKNEESILIDQQTEEINEFLVPFSNIDFQIEEIEQKQTQTEQIDNELLISDIENIVSTVITEENNSISDEVTDTLLQLQLVRDKALNILNLVESKIEKSEDNTQAFSNESEITTEISIIQLAEPEEVSTSNEITLENELLAPILESEEKTEIESIVENEEVSAETLSISTADEIEIVEILSIEEDKLIIEDAFVENIFREEEKSVYEFKNITLNNTVFDDLYTSREGYFNFYSDENASFANFTLDYLQNLRKEKRKKKTPTKVQQTEIIDNFIVSKPKLSKITKSEISDSQTNNKDLAEKSVTFTDKLISETFAKILLKQGKKSQAIEMYQKLILKYPQKKTYFVELIKNLEEK